MEGLYVTLAIFGVIILFYFISIVEKAKKYDALDAKFRDLKWLEEREASEKARVDRELKQREKIWEEKKEREQLLLERRRQKDREAAERLFKQKSMGFPWLAEAYGQYVTLEDDWAEQALRTKKRPAIKAADEVREAKRRRRASEQKAKSTDYILSYLRSLFPWLDDFIAETEDEELLADVGFDGSVRSEDPAQRWLSPEEFRKLKTCDRNQLALERFLGRKKSRLAIGLEYERYVGYKLEQEGYRVNYTGISDGLEDMGRDLVATKGSETLIVQCKLWSTYKTIFENHLFQLFGTTVEYWINKSKSCKQMGLFEEVFELIRTRELRPIFATSTSLSKSATDVAHALGIEVWSNYKLSDFPRIKCNISEPSKERIYHLPFDQQYDKVIIEPEKGEFYAETTRQAKDAGFRRAYRWRGSPA